MAANSHYQLLKLMKQKFLAISPTAAASQFFFLNFPTLSTFLSKLEEQIAKMTMIFPMGTEF